MEIYESLKNDHNAVKELLEELISLDKDDDYRMVLIQEIANALIPHSRAEESVFYNTIRAIDADTSLVTHAYKEHMEAESLLRMLQVEDKVNVSWKDTALKLKEALEHHIQEEETNLFAQGRNLFTKEEATMMNDAFVALKAESAKEGFIKNSLDMVVNLMPPRIVNKVRNLGSFSSKQ